MLRQLKPPTMKLKSVVKDKMKQSLNNKFQSMDKLQETLERLITIKTLTRSQ
jgi:hypothetical protein